MINCDDDTTTIQITHATSCNQSEGKNGTEPTGSGGMRLQLFTGFVIAQTILRRSK